MALENRKTAGRTPEDQSLFLGRLASGQKVVDRKTSHLHESPQMRDLLREAFQHMQLTDEKFVRAIIDFNRPIGESMCVSTGPEDTIIYAQREKRAGLTRFAMNRSPEPTQLLNIILMKNKTMMPRMYS
jgi:hypothetical protein